MKKGNKVTRLGAQQQQQQQQKQKQQYCTPTNTTTSTTPTNSSGGFGESIGFVHTYLGVFLQLRFLL